MPGAPKPQVLPVVASAIDEARRVLPQHHVWLQRVLGMKEFPTAAYLPPGWLTGKIFPI